jgi:hypothetical protein
MTAIHQATNWVCGGSGDTNGWLPTDPARVRGGGGANGDGGEPATLVEVLLDLGRYDHPELTMEAINLLTRLYGCLRHDLDCGVAAVCLMSPTTVELAASIEQGKPLLQRLLARSQLQFVSVAEAAAGAADVDETAAICRFLAQTMAACTLDDGRPCHTAQKLVANSYLSDLLIGFITSRNDAPPKLMDAIFEFLKVTARAFPEVSAPSV